MGLYFEKKQQHRNLCKQSATKERKKPPVVILQQVIFSNIFILCLWLRTIKRFDQGVQFMNFPSQIFLAILIMVIEQLYLRIILCGYFRFIWLWLLIAIMKWCAERCAQQLYCNSLNGKVLAKWLWLFYLIKCKQFHRRILTLLSDIYDRAFF